MPYKTFDVVIVPFPFVDSLNSKIRPAVVLSHLATNKAGSITLAMITSAKQQNQLHDLQIGDLSSAKLTAPSIIRMKLFTIDTRLIKKIIGKLSITDEKNLQELFQQFFSDLIGSKKI